VLVPSRSLGGGCRHRRQCNLAARISAGRGAQTDRHARDGDSPDNEDGRLADLLGMFDACGFAGSPAPYRPQPRRRTSLLSWKVKAQTDSASIPPGFWSGGLPLIFLPKHSTALQSMQDRNANAKLAASCGTASRPLALARGVRSKRKHPAARFGSRRSSLETVHWTVSFAALKRGEPLLTPAYWPEPV
jgi:hypothetical protein